MPKVKTVISGWHSVDRETALRIASIYYYHITCIKDRVGYINANKLKDVSFTEEELNYGVKARHSRNT